MKKMFLKRILNILDTIEIQGIPLHQTPLLVYNLLMEDRYTNKLVEVEDIIYYLYDNALLMESENGIDLFPAPTIYAKSNQNSGLEALAIMESFLRNSTYFQAFQQQFTNNIFITKNSFFKDFDLHTKSILLQSTLFEVIQNQIRLHPRLMKGIEDILLEYNEHTPLLSTALAVLFTSDIVHHEDPNIAYKNTITSMVAYPRRHIINAIISRKGIPHDRDETKALQTFYKDVLFHEFHHACPICNITFPHMLIASHIKPFRDCSHIYEAIDHNNGLLLCRNHDYLFDQGYFTFDEDGYIILSQALLDKGYLEETYTLRKNFQLPSCLLTIERKLFLAYHRKHIFRDSTH